MRSGKVGWVRSQRLPVAANQRWATASLARPWRTPRRSCSPPTASNTCLSAAGLRVNCTASASASRSCWRQAAACSNEAKKRPTPPAVIITMPSSTAGNEPPGFWRQTPWTMPSGSGKASECPVAYTPFKPSIHAIMRVLVAMSPLRMWLNSWATSACNCSRSRRSTAPRVTSTDARSGWYPAAIALMESSRESR